MTDEILRSRFYSGLSGIQLPIPKYQYPPEFQNSSRLTYYASHFNTIEVNSSFYKIPMNSTIAKWSSCVNNNFRFSFKLFKEITHIKNLNFASEHIEKFFQTLTYVGEKKACLLIQFPPSLGSEHLGELHKLLEEIKTIDINRRWKTAIEFRNKSWYNSDVLDLLESYNITIVTHDFRKVNTPSIDTTTDFIYVRFHGPTGNYKGSYTDDFLQEYAEYINAWLDDGKTVYVYFNNTAGDAFNNLVTLNKFVYSM